MCELSSSSPSSKYRYFKKMTEKSKATNDIALYYRAVGMLKNERGLYESSEVEVALVSGPFDCYAFQLNGGVPLLCFAE